MKNIAYLILAHTDPTHLKRLIGRLSFHSQIFVHIDRKTDIRAFDVEAYPAHVMFLKERTNIRWAGYSMVEATLSLIREAMASERDFSHLVLLSGLDYPLRGAESLYRFFNAHAEHEFIKYIDMRSSPDHYLLQVQHKHFRDYVFLHNSNAGILPGKVLMKLAASLRLKNPWDTARVIPYFGSQWWALTPRCCQYMLDYVSGNPGFVEMNRQSFSPDEHFFHTLVGNSPFATHSEGVQPFEGRGTWRLANSHLIHPSLAKIYSDDDYEDVTASGRLFVRKVTTFQSTLLLNRLDDLIESGVRE